MVQFHKYSSILCLFIWSVLGLLTIGSIAFSSFGWYINLSMGLLFIIIGLFMYSRGKNLNQFYAFTAEKFKNNPHFRRFLILDSLFVLSTCIFGSLLIVAAFTRVFGEGFAVFG